MQPRKLLIKVITNWCSLTRVKQSGDFSAFSGWQVSTTQTTIPDGSN